MLDPESEYVVVIIYLIKDVCFKNRSALKLREEKETST